jgi:hypothetical protein
MKALKTPLATALLPALALILTAILSGCATPGAPQLPVQFATLKLIENNNVSATEVIQRVALVRTVLDDTQTLALGELGNHVRHLVGYHTLSPADRLLVDALLGDVHHRLAIGLDVPLSAQHRALILTVLDWIEQAAIASGGHREPSPG